MKSPDIFQIVAVCLAPFFHSMALAADAVETSGSAQAAVAPAQEDLSKYDTAEKLWAHLNEAPATPPQTAEGVAAVVNEKQAEAKEFLKRYPQDAHAALAKVSLVQDSQILTQIGAQAPHLDQDEKDLKGVLADPKTPEEAREAARVLLLSTHLQEAGGAPTEAIADEMAAFAKDFPKSPYAGKLQIERLHILEKVAPAKANALVAKLLKNTDPEVAGGAKAEQAKMDIQKKPLELKFTAVDGSEVNLSKLRGKVVLVDFWATWCGPCMEEAPNVVETYKEYHKEGFDIVGISLDQDKEKLAAVTKEQGMVWPQYFDGQGWQNKISSGYGIEEIPTMWLVNKKGMVVDMDAVEDLKVEVAKLLTE